MFLIPQEALDRERTYLWMEPETDVFETIHLVDEIRIPHQSWIVDPEREKVELSCEQSTDGNGNIRKTLIVMPDALDDEMLRLFRRRKPDDSVHETEKNTAFGEESKNTDQRS